MKNHEEPIVAIILKALAVIAAISAGYYFIAMFFAGAAPSGLGKR